MGVVMRAFVSICAWAFAACSVISCNINNLDNPVVEPTDSSISLTFNRDAFSKSELGENNAAVWSAGDEVAVFDAEGSAPKKFSTTESGASVSFTCATPNATLQSGEYFMVYPYALASSASVSNKSIELTIPAEQKAVKGSFDPDAALAVCKGASGDGEYFFKNAHTLFRVVIPEGLGVDISSITLSCNSSEEKLAGAYTVNYSGQEPILTPKEGAVSTISLSGESGSVLTPGAYYIVGAPVNVSAGINVNLIDASGRVYYRYSSSSKSFLRNYIYNLGATITNTSTSIILDAKYYTEGESYVFAGRENVFPATVSGVSNATFTSLPEGWNARLESDKLVVKPNGEMDPGVYEVQLLAYAEGAKADIYTFKFCYNPSYIFYDEFTGNDIDDRYWRRFNEYNDVMWAWFQTGAAAQSVVSNGKLSLKAVYEGGTYKTGAITGKNLIEYQPPFSIECKAAMSQRRDGFWCAIWTVPTTGYDNGEIDIMEGRDHYTSSDYDDKVSCTCHNKYTLNTPSGTYDVWRPGQDQPQSSNPVINNPKDYHIYKIDVTRDAVVWYIDGQKVHEYKNIVHKTTDTRYRYAAETYTDASGRVYQPKANYLLNYPFMNNTYFPILDVSVGGTFVGGTDSKADVPVDASFAAQMDVEWFKISKIQ